MAATYDETLPTAKDRIRHALGDTDVPDGALRSDEAIVAVVAANGEALATAILAEGLAAEFAQQPDAISLAGGRSFTWRERVKTWAALAARIREELALATTSAGTTVASLTPTRGDAVESEYLRPVWWTP